MLCTESLFCYASSSVVYQQYDTGLACCRCQAGSGNSLLGSASWTARHCQDRSTLPVRPVLFSWLVRRRVIDLQTAPCFVQVLPLCLNTPLHCLSAPQHTPALPNLHLNTPPGAGQAVGAGHAHALDLQSLEQLSALGQHRAAVALLDTGVGTTQHVDDALRAQRLLLAQGRVTDALHRARSDAAALPDSGAEAVHALVGALLTWCRAHDRVAELLALPLTPPEEGAVLGALAPEVVESSARAVCDADAAVGYMLARGRVAEALLLARRVDAAVARGGACSASSADNSVPYIQQHVYYCVLIVVVGGHVLLYQGLQRRWAKPGRGCSRISQRPCGACHRRRRTCW